eukprot:scaffold1130_cov195-Pinguiococcus_pyrenoidosus.AAC.83
MELHHLRARVHRFLHFVDPAPHHLRRRSHEPLGRHQRRRRDEVVVVHDGLLDVALNGIEHGRIDDLREHADGVRAEEILLRVHVPGEAGRDDHDVVRIARFRHFLDEQVDHPSQIHVGALEQLRDAEEHLGDLRRREGVALDEDVQKLRDVQAALLRLLHHHLGIVEVPALLKHGRLLQAFKGGAWNREMSSASATKSSQNLPKSSQKLPPIPSPQGEPDAEAQASKAHKRTSNPLYTTLSTSTTSPNAFPFGFTESGELCQRILDLLDHGAQSERSGRRFCIAIRLCHHPCEKQAGAPARQ